jgi:serine/threonine protein kinase
VLVIIRDLVHHLEEKAVLSDIAARASQPQIKPLVAGDPQRLGGYEVRGRIGSGGMGAVYLGATPDGQVVAIKVIHPERTGQHEFRTRFRREVAAATRVRSRQTAAVIDYDVEGPTPWLATEYVPGPTLAQVLAEAGALPEPAVRELVAGVARALDAIHAEGLVHRDVKPANVLIGPTGPCLLDLGIVADPEETSLTTTGMQVGTPQYMSPEQALAHEVTAATDVWSLGAVAYAAATGRPPFGTGASAAVGMRIVNEQPALEALPPGLRGLVGACLAKDPAARPTIPALLAAVTQPATGTDLPMVRPPQLTNTDLSDAATELRAADAGQSMPATAPNHHGDVAGPPGRKRVGLVAGLVAAGLVLVGGVAAAAAAWWPDGETPLVAASASQSASPEQSAQPSKSPKKSPSPSPSPSATKSLAVPSSAPAKTQPTAGTVVDTPDTPALKTFDGGTVSIRSDVAIGEKITVKLGGWSPAPDGQQCVWSVGGSERDSLGSCTYTVGENDAGKPVQVKVTGTKDGYEDRTVASDPTGLVLRLLATPTCGITFERHEAVDRWSGYCNVNQDPDASYQWCWYDLTKQQVIGKAECSQNEMSYIYSYRRERDLQVRVIATRDGYRPSEYVTTTQVPKW